MDSAHVEARKMDCAHVEGRKEEKLDRGPWRLKRKQRWTGGPGAC